MGTEFKAPLHAQLYYEVLSLIDLGQDAANLYRGKSATWSEELASLFNVPGAIYLQGIPLWTRDLEHLFTALEEGFRPLDTHESRVLRQRLQDVLSNVAAGFEHKELPSLSLELEELDALRQKLWSEAAPPLEVWHIPALGDGQFTHGRAMSLKSKRVVAVSLNVAPEQALVQIIHEDTHALTDPPIRLEFGGAQETRRGSRGHALHKRLESAVIANNLALFEEHAPHLLPAFERWCGRYQISFSRQNPAKP